MMLLLHDMMVLQAGRRRQVHAMAPSADGAAAMMARHADPMLCRHVS